jgi:hypothetical protein
MDWGSLLGAGIGAGMYYWKTRQQQKAMEPDINARENALKRYQMLLNNPRLAYESDPALLAARQQRMSDVGSAQARATGGFRGGNYARQLMREGSQYDQQALDNILKQYGSLIGYTTPTLSAYINSGGGAAGAGADSLGNFMSNAQFLQLMNQWQGGGGGGQGSASGVA